MPTLASTATYNPYSPTCTANACLQQVVGLADHNPLGQYASCTSLYGAPTVTTVTLAADDIFTTATSTLSYTDIVVSLSTTYSTEEETSTSYTSVFETETAYTTTVYSTVTETASATYAPPQKKKRSAGTKKKRGGSCKPKSSTLTGSLPPSSTPAPSSSIPTSSPTASSAIPSSSAPAASSACADEETYSSACACINAVTTISTVTVSATAAPTTSTIHETVSTTITETSPSIVTIAVTTVIIQPATTTATTTTLSTAAPASLTTITTTSTHIAPTQTAAVIIDGGPRANRALVVVGNGYVQWDTTGAQPGARMVLSMDGGGKQPYLADNPQMKLYVVQVSTVVGVLAFETDAHAAGTVRDSAVTCTGNRATGRLVCETTVRGVGVTFRDMYQCGAYIYMGSPTWLQAGCVRVDIKIKYWNP